MLTRLDLEAVGVSAGLPAWPVSFRATGEPVEHTDEFGTVVSTEVCIRSRGYVTGQPGDDGGAGDRAPRRPHPDLPTLSAEEELP